MPAPRTRPATAAGIRARLDVPRHYELLSLAPATKLAYGSDVHSLPEPIALSTGWGRAALAEALDWLVARGGAGRDEAYKIARRVLAANARALYRLDRAT